MKRNALGIACLLAGCGDDNTGDGNTAPHWDSAPAMLAVGQGQSLSLAVAAVDDQGDAFGLVLTAPPELEATVSEDGSTIEARPSYLASSATLGVTLRDTPGAESALAIPFTVAPVAWLGAQIWTSGGPEAREHGALMVDDAARAAYLFGGSGYSPYLEPLADAWRYDLDQGTWTMITPSGDVPAGGGSRRVAQVPGTTTAYLFGGYGVMGASHNELYRVDFAGGELEFTLLTQSGPPTARSLHAFFYDPESDRFYAFGGVGAAPVGDTWSMQLDGDTASWTQLALATSPSPRYGFFYGFDAERGRLILFSGAQGTSAINPARDTWALDVRKEPVEWSLLLEGEAAPPGRRNGCFVLDAKAPRLWVFGGTPDAMTTEPGLWAFDARPGHERWELVTLANEPPIRSSGFGLYDPTSDRTLLGFGNTTGAVFQDLNPLGY